MKRVTLFWVQQQQTALIYKMTSSTTTSNSKALETNNGPIVVCSPLSLFLYISCSSCIYVLSSSVTLIDPFACQIQQHASWCIVCNFAFLYNIEYIENCGTTMEPLLCMLLGPFFLSFFLSDYRFSIEQDRWARKEAAQTWSDGCPGVSSRKSRPVDRDVCFMPPSLFGLLYCC